jgi:hypothetical protein
METEKTNYEKVINILRKSKPVLDTTEDIETAVIRKIKSVKKTGFVLSDVVDFLFSWVYIGWVRRSLIAASVFLVMIFVFQQSIILKQINFLSRQSIEYDGENLSATTNRIEQKLMSYKIPGRRFPSNSITISEKQLQLLLDSVNKLQIQYKDLLNIIEKDPELKKLIENKLNENRQTKFKL